MTIYKLHRQVGNDKTDQDHQDNSLELVYQCQIFKRNKIHHISINTQARKIIASGGRSFTVLPFEVLTSPPQVPQHYQAKERAINEWIITSEVLHDGTILLLNSYNVVYKIAPNTSSSKQREDVGDDDDDDEVVVTKIHCGEKSILYSGSISVLASQNKIYVAAGTVMNGVILWDLDKQEIIHSLNDHDGSIFGVKIDGDGKHVVSCSDDRSIKLYDFASGSVIATGWGHGSRIWNLEFARTSSRSSSTMGTDNKRQDDGDGNADDEKELRIMSIGEDCTLRIWKHDPTSDLLQSVKVIENCHRGKHVWSGDIDASDLQLCCTGGADGRVRLHDLQSRNQVTTKLTLSDFAAHLAPQTPISFGKKDCVRDYFELIQFNKLVCLTSNGYVLEYDYVSKKCSTIHHDDKLVGFGIVDGFNDLDLVVVADRGGNLLTVQYAEGGEHSVSRIESNDPSIKITNLLTSSMEGRYFILIESPNVKTPFKLHELGIPNVNSSFVGIVKSWDIPKPEASFPVTAMTVDVTNNRIILASKRMSLFLVDLTNLSNCLMLKKVASGDTVSTVSILNSQSGISTILVLARDGVYLILTVTQQHNQFKSDIIHENKLTRGFIEGGFFHNGADLILYGFKSSYFYVWNETRQIEIMNEYCGGNGHRHFKFYRKSLSEFSFIYSFKNDIHVCHYNGRFIHKNGIGIETDHEAPDFGVIHGGTHGREIRDVAIQNNAPLLPDGSRLLISSAEDSTIGLTKLLPNGAIHNYWNMTNHISGMQAVGFLNANYVFSCAANEEFIIWELSWLHQVAGTGAHKSINTIPTLRELARLKSDQDVPDLRVMDYDAVEYDEYILVTTVYSNSMIKLWKFDKNTDQLKFNKLHEWNYSTCCILHCQFFKLGSDNEGRTRDFLLIATTDGNVTIYNVSDPKSPAQQCQSRLHQSGVKAICLVQNENNLRDEVLLLTGGDDNALVASTITIPASNDDSQLDLRLIKREPNAASATITSISHVRDNLFVVVSVDQMIRLWSVTDDALYCQDARYTTVADTGCCDVTTVGGKHVVIVGGAGLSTWEISP
ncbi:WDR6 [Candida theae]|uniref:WDR6 n=1 Tax=Candida theae TaxID=1198502 RepID=A0AAD5BGC7_9ASCO|nr:WDR6 [Candida theae]KAI5959231.1 WDR6 [Candida theae]